MRTFGYWLGRAALFLAVVALLFWGFGPREDASLEATFEPRKFGEGVQVYFESIESKFDDILDGVEKRVVWQPGAVEQRTPVSILYVHGFSATSEELRPVPDRIAEALGANLVYTRLRGHGRDGGAMAEATVAEWMMDMAEGLAAARAVGDRVVVMSTSTGGTLAAAAALDPEMSDKIAAMIFVSPNFGIHGAGAGLLTWPGARIWLPWLIGERRSWEPQNAAHGKYWTTDYPSVATLPMAALVEKVNGLDHSTVAIPALFWFSDEDQVVQPQMTLAMAEEWGGPVTLQRVDLGPNDDADSHVVAGDILSPDQTDPAVSGMLAWLSTVLE